MDNQDKVELYKQVFIAAIRSTSQEDLYTGDFYANKADVIATKAVKKAIDFENNVIKDNI